MSTPGGSPEQRPAAPAGGPRIGLTLMTDRPERDDHLPRYGMNRTFFEAIRGAGGVPIPLAPGPPAEMELFAAPGAPGEGRVFLDGLCLTAGGDPDPALFGQEPIVEGMDIDLERDLSELRLVELARAAELPILGLCRGMQLMNIAWGGDLIQDIAIERPTASKHDNFSPTPRDEITHEIRLAEGSLLRELWGTDVMGVNSIHHQAVGRLAPGWKATAWAPDGIIEAMEPDAPSATDAHHPFLLGVQFHPEDLLALAPMRGIFEAFVAAVCARRDDVR